MPAYDRNGKPSKTDAGDFYCDANKVGGYWCPEMDIMEANQWAFAVTPHTCDQPDDHYYDKCDRGGCGAHIHKEISYGPGTQYKINTLLKFNVKTEFVDTNGELSEIRTTLT